MSDLFTNAPRLVRPIASAPLIGGAVPPPALGTPRVSEPRRAGDPIPASEQRRLAIAAQRAQPCCICRGVGLLEPMQYPTLQLVCKPHREERRRVQLEARAAKRAEKPANDGAARAPRKVYDRDTPNTEKPCTHCERPRAKHGSYCALHKKQHAYARRGLAPVIVPELATVTPIADASEMRSRAVEVIAARRAERSTKQEPAMPVKTCIECAAPRHKAYTRCHTHQQDFWRTEKRKTSKQPAKRQPPPRSVSPTPPPAVPADAADHRARPAGHHGALVIAFLRALLALLEGSS